MRVIILAGGKGVRLAPLTEVIPKPLVPLGGKPILEIIIRQLRLRVLGELRWPWDTLVT